MALVADEEKRSYETSLTYIRRESLVSKDDVPGKSSIAGGRTEKCLSTRYTGCRKNTILRDSRNVAVFL